MRDDRYLPPGLPAAGPLPAPSVSPHDISTLGERVRVIREEVVKTAVVREDVELLMEELGVAHEELSTQRDEIVATHEQFVAERHRYRELFDLAPDVYLVTDLSGNVVEANRAAAALLSVESHRIARKPLISFVVTPSRREFRQQLDAVARSCGRRSTRYSARTCGSTILAVDDEGTPIAAHLRELIFEPYVHVERSTEGTGLGLPISRRLARAMGGDLTLADAGPAGNRFELRLPAA